MKKDSKKPVVILYPPKVEVTKSDKYDICFKLQWGFYQKEFKISKEYPDVTGRVVAELNEALLIGSESQPYEIK